MHEEIIVEYGAVSYVMFLVLCCNEILVHAPEKLLRVAQEGKAEDL